MGADLIQSSIVIKKGQNMNATCQRMLKALKKMKKSDCQKFDDYYDQMSGDLAPASIQQIRKEVARTIKYVCNAIKQEYRDVTWMEHKGDMIYTSGGLSWGDAPTDSYTYFALMNALPKELLKAGKIA